MTDLSTIAELTKECGLNASVEITPYRGNDAVLIKPGIDFTENKVFSLLESLCEEISFETKIRYAIVDFGDEHTTVVDCSLYQQ